MIGNAISWKWPGAQWSCWDTYESLDWVDKVIPKPSKNEVLLAIEEYKVFKQQNRYKELRAAVYPKVDELIIALWESVVENNSIELLRLQTLREQIKLQYPKS